MPITERQRGKHPDVLLIPKNPEEIAAILAYTRSILLSTLADLQDDPTIRLKHIHGFVLYGSWINGTPHQLSDLDILGISTSQQPRNELELISKQLQGYSALPPLDLKSWIEVGPEGDSEETLLVNGHNLADGYEIITNNKQVEEETKDKIDAWILWLKQTA